MQHFKPEHTTQSLNQRPKPGLLLEEDLWVYLWVYCPITSALTSRQFSIKHRVGKKSQLLKKQPKHQKLLFLFVFCEKWDCSVAIHWFGSVVYTTKYCKICYQWHTKNPQSDFCRAKSNMCVPCAVIAIQRTIYRLLKKKKIMLKILVHSYAYNSKLTRNKNNRHSCFTSVRNFHNEALFTHLFSTRLHLEKWQLGD